jgi:pimeloyl-ACP methyl ester carboxylesterase
VARVARGGGLEPRSLTFESTGEGEPVVLVPGGLTGWISWVPHAERLSPRWRVIRVQPIPNELGSAGVPGDPSYTEETERESLRLTLDALGVGAVHLAGWSAGGTASLRFALAYPERVRTLTLVEPGSYWLLEQLGESFPGLDRSNDVLHSLFGREVSEDDLAAFLAVVGFVPSEEEARTDPGWERWALHRTALSWFSEAFDRSAWTVEDVEALTCPTLLVKGEGSLTWDRRLVDVLGELLPDATVLELPGDHASHIQSIDAFLDAFERHLT